MLKSLRIFLVQLVLHQLPKHKEEILKIHELVMPLGLSLLLFGLPLPILVAGGGSLRDSSTTGANEGAPPAQAEIGAIQKTAAVQKIAQAGLQFEVPKDWKLEQKPGPAGPAYRVISRDGATLAFLPVEEDDLVDRLAAMRSAVEKQAKTFKAGDEQEGTVNGMDYIFRIDTMDAGDDASVEETGYIKATMPVIVARIGAKKAMDANKATLDHILQSVKETE
jgi:hypothetical protein